MNGDFRIPFSFFNNHFIEKEDELDPNSNTPIADEFSTESSRLVVTSSISNKSDSNQVRTQNKKSRNLRKNRFRHRCKKGLCSDQIRALYFSLGKRLCSNRTTDKIIDLYLISVIAVVLFIILSLDQVDYYLSHLISKYWARLAIKAAIFFIIIYLVDRWLVNWRKRTNLCTIYD